MELENGDFTAVINGCEIFYAVHGRGPVCFALSNSWGLSHKGLRVLYRSLEEHLTMVYFDPRGMGMLHEFFRGTELSWKHFRYSDEVDSPTFDARKALAGITAPTLVIAGARDLMSPPKVKEIAEGIDDATIVLFENSGHFSPIFHRLFPLDITTGPEKRAGEKS